MIVRKDFPEEAIINLEPDERVGTEEEQEAQAAGCMMTQGQKLCVFRGLRKA